MSRGCCTPQYMLSHRHLLSLLLLHALTLARAFPKIHVSLQRHSIPPGNPCPYGQVLSLVKHAVPLCTCCPFRHLLSLKTHAVPKCAVSFQTQGVPQMCAVLLDVTCMDTCWSHECRLSLWIHAVTLDVGCPSGHMLSLWVQAVSHGHMLSSGIQAVSMDTLVPVDAGCPHGYMLSLWTHAVPMDTRSPPGFSLSPWTHAVPLGTRCPPGCMLLPWHMLITRMQAVPMDVPSPSPL